jgi:hypothetical protein
LIYYYAMADVPPWECDFFRNKPRCYLRGLTQKTEKCLCGGAWNDTSVRNLKTCKDCKECFVVDNGVLFSFHLPIKFDSMAFLGFVCVKMDDASYFLERYFMGKICIWYLCPISTFESHRAIFSDETRPVDSSSDSSSDDDTSRMNEVSGDNNLNDPVSDAELGAFDDRHDDDSFESDFDDADNNAVISNNFAFPEVNDSTGTPECTICMDNKKSVVLNCGHTFCLACVKKLVSFKCPMCNEPIVKVSKFYL